MFIFLSTIFWYSVSKGALVAAFLRFSPAIISDRELRSRLIRFHDGFMPFMLNASQRLQAAQDAFHDVLLDDFERDFGMPNWTLVATKPLDEIPTNVEFSKRLDDYIASMNTIRERIPEALEQIGELSTLIEAHIESL